jgi:hypothetical protein
MTASAPSSLKHAKPGTSQMTDPGLAGGRCSHPEIPSGLAAGGSAAGVHGTDADPAPAPTLTRALGAFSGQDTPVEEALRWLWLAVPAAQNRWDEESWRLLSTRHVRLARDAGALGVLPWHAGRCARRTARQANAPGCICSKATSPLPLR